MIAIRTLTVILHHSILSFVDEKGTLLQIVKIEVALHPRMNPGDLQKLVYQAVFGIDHLLGDRRRFKEDLKQEWERIDPTGTVGENPLQVIDPAGETARLHLCPCKKRGMELRKLTTFLVSQSLKNGEKKRFDRLWALAGELAREGGIPFAVEELAGLCFPTFPPHHSPGFGFSAYRVINDVTQPGTIAWLRRAQGKR